MGPGAGVLAGLVALLSLLLLLGVVVATVKTYLSLAARASTGGSNTVTAKIE